MFDLASSTVIVRLCSGWAWWWCIRSSLASTDVAEPATSVFSGSA